MKYILINTQILILLIRMLTSFKSFNSFYNIHKQQQKLYKFQTIHQSLHMESDNKLLNCKSLVICGPSGVGKGTLINKLLQDYPKKFGLSVSYTSRKPRIGEIDGIHYHFVNKEYLENDIINGTIKYIEYAKVHDNIYGTRQDEIDSIHNHSKICILDVDVNGVEQIKSNQFLAYYLFIKPKSINVLEERLRNRGTETNEQIKTRLNNAVREIQYSEIPNKFDDIMINDFFEDTYHELVLKLNMWFPNIMNNNK